MKIAFSAESAQDLDSPMSHHFGRCPYFVIVNLDKDNEIKEIQNVPNPFFESHSPGEVPAFISKQDVNVMISGGMGQKAVDFFSQYGVKVATGASETVKISLNKFLSGELSGYSPCSHSNGNCN